MMPPIEKFIWGFFGSMAIEVVNLFTYMVRHHKLPTRYSKSSFLIVRFFLAIVAGGLSIAYDISQPALAINIGAATPLIIQTFAKTNPEI